MTALWRARLDDLAAAWGRAAATTGGDMADAVSEVVDLSSDHEVWVGLSALAAAMPTDEAVVDVVRRCSLEGPDAFVRALEAAHTARRARRTVEFAVAATLVDVAHTAQVPFRTGIQRVVVETSCRWYEGHRCRLVGWTPQRDALRALDEEEVADFVARRPGVGERLTPGSAPETVLVPLGGSYLGPELTWSKAGLLSLARHGGMRTGVIGYDCVAITTAETVKEAMPGQFARYLAAVRHVDHVVAISGAAATEFRGWARMLASTGLRGPEISVAPLPDELDAVPDDDRARERFAVGRLPEVLVVGSHEPRKNHLAVLAAAETLWREGHAFSLSFVGGRSWGNEHFHRTLRRLQDDGRPVAAVTDVDDEVLAGGYRRARFSVFPSLNEGFGLPVAESLGLGTPVVTSGFGSMAEIGRAGGVLLVDPRDDDDLTDAMRRLLTDDDLLAQLREQARRRPVRTWDQYAEETWAALTGGDG